MENSQKNFQIRVMIAEDIAAAMKLKNLVGWNQIEADWERFLRIEPAGCFVAEMNHKIVGTGIAINYENKVGWIGMIITHPDHRGKGIGSALLYTVKAYLSANNVRTQKLDATPMGFSLYKRLGFITEYDIERRLCVEAKGVSYSNVTSLDKVSLEELYAFDALTFGVRRDRVLFNLVTENPELSACYIDNAQKICGYILARPGQKYFQIGPWIADTFENASNLLNFILFRLKGKQIIMDIPSVNRQAIKLCDSHHFEFQRGFIRMYEGLNAHPDYPQKIYAISGPEKG